MEQKFKSIEEFLENISFGGEIEFDYMGKHYSITHIPNGICVMESYNDSTEKIYKAASEVLEYEIKGKKLGALINDIDITFRCF